MRNARFFGLLLIGFIAACTSDDPSPASSVTDAAAVGDASPSTTDGGNTADANLLAETAAPYVEPTNCVLADDPGSPGQYADRCVKREWIKDYAGTYVSPTCELTIDITGNVAAKFSLKISGAVLAGTYANDWEGGGGIGNDSYYRFTTDATVATTKALNFSAGAAITNGESGMSLRVNDLDKGSPTFTGFYQQTVAGKNELVDCGVYLKK